MKRPHRPELRSGQRVWLLAYSSTISERRQVYCATLLGLWRDKRRWNVDLRLDSGSTCVVVADSVFTTKEAAERALALDVLGT